MQAVMLDSRCLRFAQAQLLAKLVVGAKEREKDEETVTTNVSMVKGEEKGKVEVPAV